MKFVADTNITQTVIANLRSSGHDVLDIKRYNPKISDIEIIQIAIKEKRIILTHDKDFEVYVTYPKYRAGVILIRLKKQNAHNFWQKLNEIINTNSEEILGKSLTILNEESVEIRSF